MSDSAPILSNEVAWIRLHMCTSAGLRTRIQVKYYLTSAYPVIQLGVYVDQEEICHCTYVVSEGQFNASSVVEKFAMNHTTLKRRNAFIKNIPIVLGRLNSWLEPQNTSAI